MVIIIISYSSCKGYLCVTYFYLVVVEYDLSNIFGTWYYKRSYQRKV